MTLTGAGLLEATLNNVSCAQPAHPQCAARQLAGTVLTSPTPVFWGNISMVLQAAGGAGVVTTATAYDSTSLGWGFNGGSPRSVSLSIGNDHVEVALPFDATAALHRYDMVWAPNRSDFYVDGTLVHSHNGSSVPSAPLRLWLFLYACGASWCGPSFHYAGPSTVNVASMAYTPNSTQPAACTPPPLPPTFCDDTAALQLLWDRPDTCNSSTLPYNVFCGDHTAADGSMRLDANVSCHYSLQHCPTPAPLAAGRWRSPSSVLFGQFTAHVQAAAGTNVATTIVAAWDSDPTAANITWQLPSSGRVALVGVSAAQPTAVTLPWDPTAGVHAYSVAWTLTNVTFLADGSVMHVAQQAPQRAMPFAVAVQALAPNAHATSTAQLAKAEFVIVIKKE